MEIHHGVLSDQICKLIVDYRNNWFRKVPHSPYLFKQGTSEYFKVKLKENVHPKELFEYVNNIIPTGYLLNGIHLLHYKKGGGCKKHLDVGSNLTIITALNDDFKGGELIVDNIQQNMRKGTACIFNGAKYQHSVNPVIEGERFSFNIWCSQITVNKSIL